MRAKSINENNIFKPKELSINEKEVFEAIKLLENLGFHIYNKIIKIDKGWVSMSLSPILFEIAGKIDFGFIDNKIYNETYPDENEKICGWHFYCYSGQTLTYSFKETDPSNPATLKQCINDLIRIIYKDGARIDREEISIEQQLLAYQESIDNLLNRKHLCEKINKCINSNK